MDGATERCPATGERGWLLQYLVHADRVFGAGRLDWWLQACETGALPARPIPRIDFRGASSTAVRPDLAELSAAVAERGPHKGPPLSAAGALKHVEDLIARLGGGWDGMLYFIRWLAWGLGVTSAEPRAWGAADAGTWDDLLRREFHLQRLVAAESDVLGAVLSHFHGNGKNNPTAFFPTPQEVCNLMVSMAMGGEDEGQSNRVCNSVLETSCGDRNRVHGVDAFTVSDGIRTSESEQACKNNTPCRMGTCERHYSCGDDGPPQMRQSKVRESRTSVFGNTKGQCVGHAHEGARSEGERNQSVERKIDRKFCCKNKTTFVEGTICSTDSKAVRGITHNSVEDRSRRTVDPRLASVNDPCVGTGRMLLAASNFSVNLSGCDIDQTMVDACAINMALFAPWAVYLPASARSLLERPAPTLARDQALVEGMDAARQAQGHPALPALDVELAGVTPDGEPLPHDGERVRVYEFNRHGQGELFSVPAKGAKP